MAGHGATQVYTGPILLRGINFIKQKASAPQSKHTTADFAQLKNEFLAYVETTVEMQEAELISNWDQTGIKIVPSSTWMMDHEVSKRVEEAGVIDKHLYRSCLLRLSCWGVSSTPSYQLR